MLNDILQSESDCILKPIDKNNPKINVLIF